MEQEAKYHTGVISFNERLEKYYKEKSPIFLNGYGIGKMINIGQDYVEFEVIEEKEDSKKKKGADGKFETIKEKYLVKEVITIPISKIEIISTGEKRLEKKEKEKELDNDLGAI